MNKRAVFNHYAHMLDTLLENSLFFEYYFQDCFSYEYGDIENPCDDLDWSVHFGATRVCLVDSAYDYVVKINLCDQKCCEDEVAIYSAAEGNGLEQYFIKPTYLGTYINTIRFYSMENIETALDYDIRYSDFDNSFMEHEEEFGEIHEITIILPLYAYARAIPHNYNIIYNELQYSEQSSYEEIARKHASPMTEKNLAVGIDFVKEYGEDEYARLSDFLYEYGVNDLHCGNFADFDGHFVIQDYAGYHQPYSY